LKFFKKAHDGGADSGVTGWFLVEIKPLFSIVVLRFAKGTRDAYHSHAFNAVTLWLKGRVREHDVFDQTNPKEWGVGDLKYTPRDKVHMVEALTTTWALSFRGPWHDTWQEYKNGKLLTLTHGRVVLNEKELSY
jgi:quercetin dioxygenase-like cupin family protein